MSNNEAHKHPRAVGDDGSSTTDDKAATVKVADPLVIRHLEFLGPMAEAGGWRPASELPEIAFVGRSNVGKSSLLNALVRRKAFARVSVTPGRTREINFFAVNKEFVFADLPGYGYARISKERKAAWRPLMEGYLTKSQELRGVVLLLDVRHQPSPEDQQMIDFLADLGVPTIVVFTKTDKLSSKERSGRIAELTSWLGMTTDQVVPFSVKSGAGRHELASALMGLLAQPHWRTEP